MKPSDPPGEFSLSADEAIDQIFDGTLAGFVTRRNELVKQLRAAGQKSDADALKKIAKPTAHVWLVNRWARQHPGLINRLILVVEKLRTEQLSATPDRDRMAQNRDEEREILSALEAVSAGLGETGPPSSTTVERALKMVRAAAAQPDQLDVLQRGCLAHEVVEQGFGGLSDLLATVDVASLKARREATEQARVARQTARPPVALPQDAPSEDTRPAALSAPAPSDSSGTPTKHVEHSSRQATVERLKQEVQALKARIAHHTAALAEAETQLDRTYSELDEARAALDRQRS